MLRRVRSRGRGACKSPEASQEGTDLGTKLETIKSRKPTAAKDEAPPVPAETKFYRLTEAFNGAHDVQYVDGGNAMLVFNTAVERGSWAARYELDRQNEHLTTSWAYGDDGCTFASAAGGVQALPDGHHLVNFGSPYGLLEEIDADGQVVWSSSGSGKHGDDACMIAVDVNDSWMLGDSRSYSLDGMAGVLVL